MTPSPAVCTPHTTLDEVAKLMRQNDCGEIPVVDSAELSPVRRRRFRRVPPNEDDRVSIRRLEYPQGLLPAQPGLGSAAANGLSSGCCRT